MTGQASAACSIPSSASECESWVVQETHGCEFGDARLAGRLRALLDQMGNAMGRSIPFACQDWANTKAAYRFFSNRRVTEAEVLAGHFRSTAGRIASTDGPILVLHDTTEFSYQRENPEAIGLTYRVNSGRDKLGRFRMHTVCGVLMHSSLVVTLGGVPLGLAAIKFWTRKRFKGTAALKKKVNPTRIPVEKKESVRWLENLRNATALADDPARCVHIGDRESDIYELFCAAQEVGTHFLFRTCVDRLAGDGSHTVADEMEEVRVGGRHRIEVRDREGNRDIASLELKYRRIKVLPPIGKQKRYPPLLLTVIHAIEHGTPKNRKKIEWKLVTDLPVRSRREAIEKLEWYAMRWKIETFHKILKSVCRAEDAKLRTAARLVNLIALMCILSWRVFFITMINRSSPPGPAKSVLTEAEIEILDLLVKDKGRGLNKTISEYLIKIARLGGYLARARDAPPGYVVLWRGLARLTDLQLGAAIGARLVGN